MRIIRAGTDTESLCEKKDGRCTGKSLLPWQYDSGEYTDVCPHMVKNGILRAYNMWANAKDFRKLPTDAGSYEQPARWMRILRICENEFNRRQDGE